MKCLVKDCKTRSLLMTVELCYPCSQIIEKGAGNEFKPDWDTVKPFLDRIAELEDREWVGLTNEEIDNLNLSNKIKVKQLIRLIEAKLKEKNSE